MTGNIGRAWRRLTGLCVIAGVALAAAAPQAQATAITEFSTGLEAGSSPFDMTAGPDGNVWFVDTGAIGTITPAGSIVEFSSGVNAGSNLNRITQGPDGNLWFTDRGTTRAVGRVTPAGAITEFDHTNGLNTGSNPARIAPGPDGNVWFTDTGTTPAIGRVTPAGAITEFDHANGLNTGSGPFGIILGPDGNLWFLDTGTTPAIGRVTPAGAITEFSTGLNSGSNPRRLVLGADGNMWFTDVGTTPAVGRVTPAGAIAEFTSANGLNTGSFPDELVAGADGNVWFTDEGTTNAIGRVTPAGAITEFGTANGLNPSGDGQFIVAGPDGNLWFNDIGSTPKAIGRVALELPPTASTGAASAVTSSTATVSGAVNPLGSPTSVTFRFGKTSAFGSTVVARSLAAGGMRSTVTAALAGLPPRTVFFYELVATNAFGTTTGAPKTFKTEATRPRVTNAAESHKRWRRGNRLARPAKHHKPPVGTTFSFTLNEPAAVSFAFARQVGGRKIKGKCVPQRRVNRTKPACARSVARGTLRFAGHAARNTVSFQGRISASKKLTPGRYTLSIGATAAGRRSKPQTLSFTIVK